ncbi:MULTISPECIES: YfbM family protein [Exiguobacterium]|uniref:YfbM family protein n=1 Tax=Exiguobacterium TaxID=33986 RepID=UPI001BE7A18A|nr:MULTISPECIES: YfbM family protein [Exiguobacterium]
MMGMVGAYMRLSAEELTALLQEPDDFEEFLEDEARQTDIDKAWHGLYFLLTGETDLDEIDRHSLGKVVFGGDVLDEETGIAYLTPSEVADLSSRLQYIEVESLEARYDVTTMNAHQLYPFENEWGVEEKQYLLEQFDELKRVFKQAADESEALVTWIG